MLPAASLTTDRSVVEPCAVPTWRLLLMAQAGDFVVVVVPSSRMSAVRLPTLSARPRSREAIVRA